MVITFNASVNSGVYSQHSIFISEDNIPPLMDIEIFQNDEEVSSIINEEGEATIRLNIDDANLSDTHIISWDIPDYLSAEISANQLAIYLTPSLFDIPDEAESLISLSVQVMDSGADELTQTKFIHIPYFESKPRLTSTDTDQDGISDAEEGFVDNDGDGIPAFMDNSIVSYIQPLHVNAAKSKVVETEPGLRLSLGKYARLQFSDGVQLSQQEIEDTNLIPEDSLAHSGGYFDFMIENIVPFGRSTTVVIPLLDPIPEHAVYRKYSEENGWQEFVEDADNSLSSSPLVNGVCPFYESETYVASLNAGHECIRLVIKEGGANDADGIENGVIDDPGVIGLIPNVEVAKTVDPEKSSSGGSIYHLFLLLLLTFGLSFTVNKNKPEA